MPIEAITLILGALAYLSAEKIYDIHLKIKTGEKSFSKRVSGDHKHLDNRELWNKRYRAKVLLLMVMIVHAPPIKYIFFSLSFPLFKIHLAKQFPKAGISRSS